MQLVKVLAIAAVATMMCLAPATATASVDVKENSPEERQLYYVRTPITKSPYNRVIPPPPPIHTCNDEQKKYPANKLELLSIQLVLQEYRTMLLGHEVHVHTDHLNLTYGTYNNGENNVVADTLSRLPRADDSDVQQQETLVAVAAMDLTTLSNVDLREIARCQKRDGTATLKSATTNEISDVELQVDSNTG
ncbi:hypothetical protein PHYSODRAFT_346562 [Phytophthora sojae]|uniref:Reverse transcriptase RNase H-like domain-containing protein n=1 Tax=Phytophthora sojae (strain P6497) TaxID=1094619 RepID=G4ZLX7_PHYSP|nr:hypothetical protein PHYSODRAFT_346562 [Phytophthora sojae]EGZ15312.1 hypothetical protein PHYSODRAFT_346562 [Phytophthora sojae]|eukprot:XP_009529061.1 hypothetical protein PHYSODRAFT_346562 [Phytophthora sojae]